MHLLAPLAALFGLEVEVLIERLKRSAALYITLSLFGLIGLIFLLIAANAALAMKVGPIYAPLIIGGAALVLALVIYLIARISGGGRRSREVEKRRNSETTALLTTAALTTLPVALKSPTARNLLLPLVALGAFAYLGKAIAKEHKEL